MEQAGIEDSTLRAMDYLRSTVGNRVSEERLLGFVENAPKMLKKLTEEGYLEAEIFEGFPDYRAEVKGGVLGGRSVEPKVFSGRKLGEVFGSMRARKFSSPVVGTMTELRRLAVIKTNFLGALKSWKVFARTIFGKLFGFEYVSSGRALTAWLTFSAKKIGVGFRLNHRLIELIEKDGAVVGQLRIRVFQSIFLHETVLSLPVGGSSITLQYVQNILEITPLLIAHLVRRQRGRCYH